MSGDTFTNTPPQRLYERSLTYRKFKVMSKLKSAIAIEIGDKGLYEDVMIFFPSVMKHFIERPHTKKSDKNRR